MSRGQAIGTLSINCNETFVFVFKVFCKNNWVRELRSCVKSVILKGREVGALSAAKESPKVGEGVEG